MQGVLQGGSERRGDRGGDTNDAKQECGDKGAVAMISDERNAKKK